MSASASGTSRAATSRGVAWRLWLALVIVVLAVIVIFQNTEEARLNVLFWVVVMPLWVLLLGTFLAGALAGWLLKLRSVSRAR